MSAEEFQFYISHDEYLQREAVSPTRHEYIGGTIYAMAGATPSHVRITVNAVVLIDSHLAPGDCVLYSMDMKVRIEAADTFYYPDVVVTCDERDPVENILHYPCLVIEVLSPKTEAFDRGLKFAHYREIPSLEEVVLIAQDRPCVECFRRGENGQWVLSPYGDGQIVHLESIGFQCPIEEFYRKVRLAPAATLPIVEAP